MGLFRKKPVKEPAVRGLPDEEKYDQRLINMLAQHASEGPTLRTTKHLKVFNAVLQADATDVNSDWTLLLHRLPSIMANYLNKGEVAEYAFSRGESAGSMMPYENASGQYILGRQWSAAHTTIQERDVVSRASRAWLAEILKIVSNLGNGDLTCAVENFFTNPMHVDILATLDNELVDADKKKALAKYLDDCAKSVVKYVVDATKARAETNKMQQLQQHDYAKAMANSNADVLLSQIGVITP